MTAAVSSSRFNARRLYAVAMSLCATVLSAAQGPPPVRAPRTLRSSVEVTAVTVTVRDGDGRLVTGLPREAFSVYEDGELPGNHPVHA